MSLAALPFIALAASCVIGAGAYRLGRSHGERARIRAVSGVAGNPEEAGEK